MGIQKQVIAALNAAHHENQYPHEFDRAPADIVAEINDWSGIEGFNPENPKHARDAETAVRQWRAYTAPADTMPDPGQ